MSAGAAVMAAVGALCWVLWGLLWRGAQADGVCLRHHMVSSAFCLLLMKLCCLAAAW